ncbi:hypothetical protein HKX48_003898 [Thoreauomyces humboldtii]|nr:hypothetical protein HKX48_003898 [Thoreauomyces humboldtii]
MKVAAITLALALAATSVSAAAVSSHGPPTQPTHKLRSKSFSLPLSRGNRSAVPVLKDIPAIIAHTAMRHDVRAPSSGVTERGQAKPVLTNTQNFGYTVPVVIGGQNFNLQVDTGSSDIWVADVAATGPIAGSNRFDPSKSSTYQNTGQTFAIQYLASPAQGTIAQDTISIGSLSLSGQQFGDVTSEGNGFMYFMDGFLGLGWATDGMEWFTNACQQGLLDYCAFSLYLSNAPNSDSTSVMTLGNPWASTSFSGSISWVQSIKTDLGHWALPLTALTYNGVAVKSTLKQAVLDSGATFVTGPPADVAALNAAIGAKLPGNLNLYLIDCGARATAHPISFTVGAPGASYTLTLNANEYLVPTGAPQAGGKCYSIFQAYTPSPGMSPVTSWLLGDFVLRKYYSAFYFGQNTPSAQGTGWIGFAPVSPAFTGY